MAQTISATRAKNTFGEMTRQVYLTGERVVVERDGLPVVAMISMADYTWLKKAAGQAKLKPKEQIGKGHGNT